MNDKVEAMQEAIEFIQRTWMGTLEDDWEGTSDDFVQATLGSAVTVRDVQEIVEAYKSGEWSPVDYIDEDIEDGRLTKVRIWK